MQPRSLEAKTALHKYAEQDEKIFISGDTIMNNAYKRVREKYAKEEVQDKTIYANVSLTEFSTEPMLGLKALNANFSHDVYASEYDRFDIPRFYDERFKIYNSEYKLPQSIANLIEGTRLVLSATGGKRNFTIKDYFDAVIFNEQFPIDQVIVLGGKKLDTIDSQLQQYDFPNLYFRPMIGQATGGPYRITVEEKNISGWAEHYTGYTYFGDITTSRAMVTRVGKERKTFDAIFFPITDNTFPEFKKTGDLEHIWNLILSEKNTATNCGAGVGRTGAFTLLRFLISRYPTIYDPKQPVEQHYRNIYALLEELRIAAGSPCLVLEKQQWIAVIKSADHLYEYGLEKGYVQKLLEKHKNESKTQSEPSKSSTAKIAKTLEIAIQPTSSSSTSYTDDDISPINQSYLTTTQSELRKIETTLMSEQTKMTMRKP